MGVGPREAAWQLRALTTLAEDPGLFPNTPKVAHTHPSLQFQGTQCPFLTSEGSCMQVVHSASVALMAQLSSLAPLYT